MKKLINITGLKWQMSCGRTIPVADLSIRQTCLALRWVADQRKVEEEMKLVVPKRFWRELEEFRGKTWSEWVEILTLLLNEKDEALAQEEKENLIEVRIVDGKGSTDDPRVVFI